MVIVISNLGINIKQFLNFDTNIINHTLGQSLYRSLLDYIYLKTNNLTNYLDGYAQFS